MEEKTLIQVLIIMGVFSLSTMIISNLLLEKTALGFVSKFAPYAFCAKDYKGNYTFAKPASFDLCSNVNDMENFLNLNLCEDFAGEKKTACLGLVEIAKNRTDDCRIFLSTFGQSKPLSVNPNDVEKYCKIMNVTIPNISSSKSGISNATF